MSRVDLETLKTLRARSGAGMGDCKAALLESQGSLEGAERCLLAMAKKKLEKKASRPTREGEWKARCSEDLSRWMALEVACETDFVKGSDLFQSQAEAALDVVWKERPDGISDHPALEAIQLDLVQRTDEHIRFGRYLQAQGDCLAFRRLDNGKTLILLVFKSEARDWVAHQSGASLMELALRWDRVTASPGRTTASALFSETLKLVCEGRALPMDTEAWSDLRSRTLSDWESLPGMIQTDWIGAVSLDWGYRGPGGHASSFAEEVQNLLKIYEA